MTTMGVMGGIPHLLWTTSWQAGVMAGAIWLACRQWPRMPANLRVMLWWLVSLKFVLGLVWTQPVLLPVLPAAGTPSIGSGDVIINGSKPLNPGLERGDNPFRHKSKPLSLGERLRSGWFPSGCWACSCKACCSCVSSCARVS
jgi:hypothetical protein